MGGGTNLQNRNYSNVLWGAERQDTPPVGGRGRGYGAPATAANHIKEMSRYVRPQASRQKNRTAETNQITRSTSERVVAGYGRISVG